MPFIADDKDPERGDHAETRVADRNSSTVQIPLNPDPHHPHPSLQHLCLFISFKASGFLIIHCIF